jgi:hypothetical protein
MHELQLEPVGIGEEHGVVAGSVVWIVRRGVEDAGACAKQQLMEPIDIAAALGMPGKMMQPRTVAVASAI